MIAFNDDQFEKQGFIALSDFISSKEATEIRALIDELKLTGSMKKAGIGKETSFQVNTSVRGDFIQWIDPQNAQPAINPLLQKLNELILHLNRTFYLGIRDFESHLTFFPPGAHYARHSDRHHHSSHRKVSFVLYLNENWKKEDGGELVMYPENGIPSTIEPRSGVLAVFLSHLEHEVLLTHSDRRSITGWMLDREFIL